MLNDVRMRIAQVGELVSSNGWSSLFKEVLFFKRTAIVVEKDLSELTERPKPLASAKLKLIEIDKLDDAFDEQLTIAKQNYETVIEKIEKKREQFGDAVTKLMGYVVS